MTKEFEKIIPVLNALVYYSQISTVQNVRPVGMDSHDEAWRKGQKWLWKNCDLINGQYRLKSGSNQ